MIASRNPALSRDQAFLADDRVVADVHMVVDLGPLADGRRSGHSPVDGTQRTDLHIVPNHHVPTGEQTVVPLGTMLVVKRVSTDDRTRIDDHPVADTRTVANDHPGVQHAILPDLHVVADEYPGLDERSPAYLGIGSDHSRRGDKRTERMGYLVEIAERIIGNDQRLALGAFHVLVDQHHGSGASQRLVVILGMIDKNYIAVGNAMYLIYPRHRKIRRAHVFFGPYHRGDFRECFRSGKFHLIVRMLHVIAPAKLSKNEKILSALF